MDTRATTTRRLLLVLTMLGMLTVVTLAIARGSALLPGPTRALVSPSIASPTATASPRWAYASPRVDVATETPPPTSEPSTSVEPTLASEPFRSSIHGYSLHPPEQWKVSPATVVWDGSDPWGAGMADLFDTGDSLGRLTVVSTRLPKRMTGEAWIQAHSLTMPQEFEPVGGPHCVFRRGGGAWMIPGASASLTDGVVDGRPASIRTICGHITASVVVGKRVYQLSLFVNRRPTGDRALFDAIMATVDFDPPAPATGFRSSRYIYGLEVPGGWTAVPATESWGGSGRPSSSAADALVGPRAMGAPRLTIAAQTKPGDVSEDRFVADAAPLPDAVRTDGPTVSCAFGDSIVERGPVPSTWAVDVIGGHRARLRAMCGTVDAVVFVGNRGYLFTLESGQATTGDLERFRDLVASVRFDDGLVRFVSDVYGYSLRYPRGWQAIPASQPWEGGSSEEGIDRFAQGSDRSLTRFGVAAHPLEAGQTEDGWIARYVPRIRGLMGTRCRFGPTYVLAPEASASWQPTIIDGRSARLRAACGRVDGVIFDDGIGYWLTLSTNERRTDADVSAFNQLADTIDLDAVPRALGSQPAGPTRTFASTRYGYTVKIPADWRPTSAKERWTGPGPWVTKMADRFAEPLEIPRRFMVAARPLKGRVLDEAWLASHVPNPGAASGTICRSADGTPRSIWRYMTASAQAKWRESVVAGRPARLRSLCGQVQAVIQVGDTAFVLTSFRSDTAEWAFREIADTFRMSP